jgi:hypothetical protein
MKSIVLCLSGGGFRATIFHLGVLDSLLQNEIFGKIDSVYGVSGGSVCAAYLAHAWTQMADRAAFPAAAIRLLEKCHRGILDEILSASALRQRNRSDQLSQELASLFETAVPDTAKPTYLLSSSLTDMSYFGFEVKSKRLFRMPPDLRTVEPVGKSTLTTATAAAMSACFPAVFEPMALSRQSTGIDMKTLQRERVVADGGIVDNLGLTFAAAKSGADLTHTLFLVSDAATIFDDFDVLEGKISALLSPLRVIDYLMVKNAESRLAVVGESIKSRGGSVSVIRLSGARDLIDKHEFDIPPGLIAEAMRIRTNFNAFKPGEIITLYRLGILLAREALHQEQLTSVTNTDPHGLVKQGTIGAVGLDQHWSTLNIPSGSSNSSRLLDFIMRKPGAALIGLTMVVFLAACAVGVGLRAWLR